MGVRARLEQAGVPVERVRLGRALDPLAFGRLVRSVRRRGRRSCTRTSSTPTSTASRRPASRACPCASRRSTASTRSASAARSRSPTGRSRGSPTVHIAISRGLARYLAATRGLRREGVRDRPLRHRGRARSRRRPAGEPRLAVRRPADSDQGPRDRCCARSPARARRSPASSSTSAGDGPLEPELRATRRAARRSSEAVAFLGRVAPVQPVLERAAIVVVPSLGEGFGMVALEAMERGRAVIASDGRRAPEIVATARRGSSCRRASPRRSPRRSSRSPATAARQLDAGRRRPRARGRRRSRRSRCTRADDELYRAALDRAGRGGAATCPAPSARSSANAASSASRKSKGAR